MKRPAFQFYPDNWRNNANLRRCSWAARGVWVEVMCLMHDSDRYGVLEWPIKEIAQALGCTAGPLAELVTKGVMKGCDTGACEPYVYIPRSGRRDGPPVTLVDAQAGPVWYSSRMVKDEYVRKTAGASTRFGSNEDGEKPHRNTPSHSPSRRLGEDLSAAPSHRRSDGSSSPSPSPSSCINTQPLPFPLVREAVERFSKTAPRDNAAAFHAAMVGAMRSEGWSVTAEFPVPDRGDGRGGRIDAVVTVPAVVGLEFDRCSVRAKSVEKLSHIDGYRVVVLRDADSHPPMHGIDAVVCCGKASAVPEGFAEFYAKYPRHVARAAAERAWSKLDPDEPLRERIMAALVHNGFDYREDGRFIPHPASWLNAQRWDDETTLLLDEVAEQVNRV